MLERVKSHFGLEILLPASRPMTAVVDDLIECGVDILNPVQVAALGDTAALKVRFGSKVTFWGAIDTQHVLPHGSAQDVEFEVTAGD